ncbi:MAG TPA: glycosyltransferase [Acidimicrobiales bacterium]|nr:glycosyltransferase [Acidimicrobiales bacterium]
MTASVVIVSYRPGEWLAASIRSALVQADQVVVVDNGSEGATASAISRDLGAEVVRSAGNLGFAGGVELGLGRARGEVIGILNDDAEAGEGWLARATAVLADPTVAAVTPKVVLADAFAEVTMPDDEWFAPGDRRPLGRMLRSVTAGGTEMLARLVGAGVHELEWSSAGDDPDDHWRWTAGRRPFYVPLPDDDADAEIRVNGEPVTPDAKCRILNHAGSYLERHGVAGEYGLGAPDDGRFDDAAERFGFSGTAPVFRAETLGRVGAFAVPFFAYDEDTDWCLRARLAGLRILYEPGATVTHRWSATSGGSASARVRFLQQRNSLFCLVRNAPAGLAAGHLWSLARKGSGPGVRRAVAARLPWALATRARLHRTWVTTPADVWDRWAGADRTWDDGPARVEGRGVQAGTVSR